MPTLLVIDDEAPILHFFRRAFRSPEIVLETASTAAEGLQKAADLRPDVIVLDIQLPDRSGLETFQSIRETDCRIPVIFITGHGTTDTAIEAMCMGAFEYLLKPLELSELRSLVERAFEISRLMRVPPIVVQDSEQREHASGDVLVGRTPAIQEVYKAIGRVAPQDVTVLILGESGTGKELVARAIYHYSKRSKAPFLAINCAAIPESLLEAELFGHEKGAFTGAERKRIGKFEQCNGGTLFLDEIGDMTPLTQTKVLRVLQDQQFERVGGNEAVRTNVRLIAATNCNLEEMVAAGRFRGDLYYRLNVFTIKLPPLRDRGDDLPLLVDHFVRRFSRELGSDIRQTSTETLDILRQYSWPGNLRELQSVIKQSILQASGRVLIPDFLPVAIRTEKQHAPSETQSLPQPADLAGLDPFIRERLSAGTHALYDEVQALVDRHLIALVLNHTGRRLSQTAEILGINRSTLRAKMSSLGLAGEKSMSADEE